MIYRSQWFVDPSMYAIDTAPSLLINNGCGFGSKAGRVPKVKHHNCKPVKLKSDHNHCLTEIGHLHAQLCMYASWAMRCQLLQLLSRALLQSVKKIKKLLPPVNWRWVKEGDGYVRHEAWPHTPAVRHSCLRYFCTPSTHSYLSP
jgi:hypothetical protein